MKFWLERQFASDNAEILVLTHEEAKQIMLSGLGEAELRFATSLTAPIWWVIKNPNGTFFTKNGSAFFLDAGEGPFGVTANHVIEGWRRDCAEKMVVACQIGRDLTFEFDRRRIDSHVEIDIATFRVESEEIASLGKTVLAGHQKNWPPAPPEMGRGVYFSGFPGTSTMWLSQEEISFGAAPGAGVANSISEVDVSSQIEREHLFGVLGNGIPPEGFDFGGMSGGPMLTVVEHAGIRSWRLAGVIYEGPKPIEAEGETIPGFEVIRARRTDFIKPDGALDVGLWATLNMNKLHPN